MARAPVLVLLLCACVAGAPEADRADWLSDLSLCGMPAEVQAMGDPVRLLPGGARSQTASCSWSPAIDPARIGVVQRSGSCTAVGRSAAASFLISVTEAGVRVGSDHPALGQVSFGRCPLPGPAAPEPAPGAAAVPQLPAEAGPGTQVPA